MARHGMFEDGARTLARNEARKAREEQARREDEAAARRYLRKRGVR